MARSIGQGSGCARLVPVVVIGITIGTILHVVMPSWHDNGSSQGGGMRSQMPSDNNGSSRRTVTIRETGEIGGKTEEKPLQGADRRRPVVQPTNTSSGGTSPRGGVIKGTRVPSISPQVQRCGVELGRRRERKWCDGWSMQDVSVIMHDPSSKEVEPGAASVANGGLGGPRGLGTPDPSGSAMRELMTALRPLEPFDTIQWPSSTEATRGTYGGGPFTATYSYVSCRERNVLVSFAVGYGSDVLSRLIGTFRSTHTPCDDLVLFVDEKPSDLIVEEDGSSGRVFFERYNDYTKAIPPSAPKLNIKNSRSYVSWLRVAFIDHWLSNHWNQYKYIVLLDARDVVIGGNIFLPLYRHGIDGLFSTREVTTMRERGVNQQWLTKCIGAAYTGYVSRLTVPLPAAVANLTRTNKKSEPVPVLCNGLVGGTAAAMRDYFYVYNKVTLLKGTQKRFCADQAVHVMMMLTGLPTISYPHRVHMLNDRVGPYRHMYIGGIIRRDRRGRHLNCLNEPYAVVHQLDRDGYMWAEAGKSTPPLIGEKSSPFVNFPEAATRQRECGG